MRLTATQRVEMVTQPKGGYIPPASLQEEGFNDLYVLDETPSAYKTIAGVATDYLTRMHFVSKTEAFRVALKGAFHAGEYEEACEMIGSIDGLSDQSIITACKLTAYDSFYRSRRLPNMDDIVPDETSIKNIRIMVKRSVEFFREKGLVLAGVYFDLKESLIGSADGDFMTEDTLWDMKASLYPPTKEHTLQLLVYYILYSHTNMDYVRIKKLGVWNPFLHKTYTIELSKIPDSVLYEVSNKVIGYEMQSDSVSKWHLITGEMDPEIVNRFVKEHFTDTGFRPHKYPDGIHDITIDDYWSYYRTIVNDHWSKPKFRWTSSVKFLKKGPYSMFVSISHKGKLCLLYGGSYYSLLLPVEWYYEHMEEYADKVLQMFLPYWNYVYALSARLSDLQPDKALVEKTEYQNYLIENNAGTERRLARVTDTKVAERLKEIRKPVDFDTYFERFRRQLKLKTLVHGCIVDLDFYNHVYVNPFDGTMTAYRAASMQEQRVYNNLGHLLESNFPYLLPDYKKSIMQEGTPLLPPTEMNIDGMEDVPGPDEKKSSDAEGTLIHETGQYKISRVMKALQFIYDNNLICAWVPSIIPMPLIEKKHQIHSGPIVGEEREMKCKMTAKVIEDNGYDDITVEFSDGTVVEHTTRDKFRRGTVKNPNLEKPKKETAPRKERVSQVGISRMMNCGLMATVTAYNGANDVTVEFEDGLIREHMRIDKFREGKIGHTVK